MSHARAGSIHLMAGSRSGRFLLSPASTGFAVGRMLREAISVRRAAWRVEAAPEREWEMERLGEGLLRCRNRQL